MYVCVCDLICHHRFSNCLSPELLFYIYSQYHHEKYRYSCTSCLISTSKLALLALDQGWKPLSVMFGFNAASRLNSSNSRCSEMILENCPARRGCDSDEDRSECQPLFFGNSELFEKACWQRQSTGIIVLLLRLKRLIHHAAAGSGGVRKRRRRMEEVEDEEEEEEKRKEGPGEEMRPVDCFTKEWERKKKW